MSGGLHLAGGKIKAPLESSSRLWREALLLYCLHAASVSYSCIAEEINL